MYVLGSDITIGSFRFGGVHSVRVRKSLTGYVDTCTITVPSVARIVRKGKKDAETVIVGKMFQDGDKVTVKLGYNGQLNEEFRGFVRRRNLNMPLEIECEGYSYQLRRNKVKGYWKSVTVKELLEEAIKGTDITLEIPDEDNIPLTNVRTRSGVESNGCDLLDFVMKQSAFRIFFKAPTVLYAGLKYLDYKGEVKYRLGWNVVKDNSLKEKDPSTTEVQINAQFKTAKGVKHKVSTAAVVGRVKKLNLGHVQDAAAQQRIVDAVKERISYAGYEGRLNAFLVPYAEPGYKAYIVDSRYGERDGSYIIESTEVTYGTSGARRTVEIGKKV